MSDLDQFLKRRVLRARQKRLNKLVWIVSVFVFILVLAMGGPYKIPTPEGLSFKFLPLVHAIINTLVALSLIGALLAVRKGNIKTHQRFMTAALILSCLFLLSYVTYHFTTVETKFGGQGALRYIYFFFLISHIIASAISLPFILLSYVAAWTNDFARHRRLVHFVYPVWLYVAITGPICYLLLRPYY